MKTRVITSIYLLITIAIIGYIDNFFVTWITLGVVTLVALQESLKLYDSKYEITTLITASILWLFVPFFKDPAIFSIGIILSLTTIMLYRAKFSEDFIKPFIYPFASFLVMLSLYNSFGMFSFAWLILVVAATDTFAYFGGKKFGKIKFSDYSPGKTKEGVCSGVIFGTLFGSIYAYNEFGYFAILVSLLVSIFSVYGDLYESKLKREAGVKDSGNILSGHGGVLDRVDGYLFASIAMYVLLKGI